MLSSLNFTLQTGRALYSFTRHTGENLKFALLPPNLWHNNVLTSYVLMEMSPTKPTQDAHDLYKC